MPDITIVTVNWFSGSYILSMLENLYANAHRRDALRVLIVDNTNGQDDLSKILEASPIPCTLSVLDSRGLKGSRGHALALDHAMAELETEFAVIIDPDIHVFWRNWDQFCVSQLQQHNAIAIGVPYPAWKVGKYHNFPSPPFCFFRTQILQQLKNGWSPYGATLLHNLRTFCIRQVGRLGNLLTRKRYEKYPLLRKYADFAEKTFGVFSQDTGWKLAEEVRTKGLKTIVFDTVLPEDALMESQAVETVFRSMACEYELFACNHRVFLAHKYGTGGLPWRTKRGGNETYWQKCINQVEDILKGNSKDETP